MVTTKLLQNRINELNTMLKEIGYFDADEKGYFLDHYPNLGYDIRHLSKQGGVTHGTFGTNSRLSKKELYYLLEGTLNAIGYAKK